MTIVERRDAKSQDDIVVTPADSPNEDKGIISAALSWRELRKTPYGVGPIVVLTLLGLFTGLGGAVTTVAGPDIARDLDLDLATIGGIFSTVGVIGLFTSIPLSSLADRYPRKPIAGLALVASGVADILGSRATGPPTYVATQVGSRVVSEPIQPAVRSLLADYYPVHTRGRVFSLLGITGEAADLVSLVVVGFMVASFGWRDTKLALAVPVLVS